MPDFIEYERYPEEDKGAFAFLLKRPQDKKFMLRYARDQLKLEYVEKTIKSYNYIYNIIKNFDNVINIDLETSSIYYFGRLRMKIPGFTISFKYEKVNILHNIRIEDDCLNDFNVSGLNQDDLLMVLNIIKSGQLINNYKNFYERLSQDYNLYDVAGMSIRDGIIRAIAREEVIFKSIEDKYEDLFCPIHNQPHYFPWCLREKLKEC